MKPIKSADGQGVNRWHYRQHARDACVYRDPEGRYSVWLFQGQASGLTPCEVVRPLNGVDAHKRARLWARGVRA